MKPVAKWPPWGSNKQRGVLITQLNEGGRLYNMLIVGLLMTGVSRRPDRVYAVTGNWNT